MDYINFFKNRGIKFCWHHLQYKYYWHTKIHNYNKNLELLRLDVNNELLKTSPPFHLSINKYGNYGESCICQDDSSGTYSLLECLCIDIKPINVNYYINNTNISYLDNLLNIEINIDDLITWNVPFIDEENSNYPISSFSSLFKASYLNNIPNKKVDEIINKVQSRILYTQDS